MLTLSHKCIALVFGADYQNTNTANEDDEARKLHAERIIATYISPSALGVPGLIYTSEAQRKALRAKMRRLWRRDKPSRKINNRSNREGIDSKSGTLVRRDVGPAADSNLEDRGASLNDGRRVQHAGRGSRGGDGESIGVGAVGDVGDVGAVGDGDNGLGFSTAGGVLPDSGASNMEKEQRSQSNASYSEESFSGDDGSASRSGTASGSDGDGEIMDEIEDKEGGRQAVDRLALTRSLFDKILDQNAIPTIRQNSEFSCFFSSSICVPRWKLVDLQT